MSNTDELQMEIGSIVELRDGFERVYPMSFPGAQAKVADYTIDPEGFERVLLNWDKGHYRYNGERDNWTYASHFRVIAPAPPVIAPRAEPEQSPVRFTPVKPDNETSDPGRAILRYLNSDSARREVPQETPQRNSHVDRYAEVMRNAFKAVEDGAGFFIVTVSPDESEGGRLKPYLYTCTLDAETTMLIHQAVCQVASNFMGDDDE